MLLLLAVMLELVLLELVLLAMMQVLALALLVLGRAFVGTAPTMTSDLHRTDRTQTHHVLKLHVPYLQRIWVFEGCGEGGGGGGRRKRSMSSRNAIGSPSSSAFPGQPPSALSPSESASLNPQPLGIGQVGRYNRLVRSCM